MPIDSGPSTLTVNYETLTNDDYTPLNQRYELEQCYHPAEREIKKNPSTFWLNLVELNSR